MTNSAFACNHFGLVSCCCINGKHSRIPAGFYSPSPTPLQAAVRQADPVCRNSLRLSRSFSFLPFSLPCLTRLVMTQMRQLQVIAHVVFFTFLLSIREAISETELRLNQPRSRHGSAFVVGHFLFIPFCSTLLCFLPFFLCCYF